MTHTEEPWKVVFEPDCPFDLTIMSGDEVIAAISVQEAKFARIVSCVNALAGLNPDAVADVVAALEYYAEAYCEGYGECVGDLCGKFTPEECGGCKAYTALARIRGEG